MVVWSFRVVLLLCLRWHCRVCLLLLVPKQTTCQPRRAPATTARTARFGANGQHGAIANDATNCASDGAGQRRRRQYHDGAIAQRHLDAGDGAHGCRSRIGVDGAQ